MERYESWIERAKSSLELAGAKIIRYIHYTDFLNRFTSLRGTG
jgi:hypothetical protein